MQRLIFVVLPVFAAIAIGFWVADRFITEPNTAAPSEQQVAQTPTVQQPAPLPVQTDPNLTLGINTSVHLGSFLVGRTSYTLYTFAKDQAGTSTCYAQCAQNWPPYLVTPGVQPKLQTGISAALVGTITRTDDTTQLTYRGLPLYYYTGDARTGDATGQGIGGVWYAVNP